MAAADRSLRSVFVGNIPYDATEEKLRDIFSAVGPVLGFRIVFDRETGKPKGYGFCEYKDQETATSAIRNLNGHDLGGRQLRVDSASNERARDDPSDPQQQQQQNVQQQQQHPQQHQQQQQPQQQMLGNDNPMHQVQPVAEPMPDAQTVINNVLCSLPPENLFDICKQLKTSLLVNPNETRQLLVQNPQLSFAILQSLVMIKSIDAQTAMNTLHKQLLQPAPLLPTMPSMMAMMQPQVMNPYPFVATQPTNIGPVQSAVNAAPVVQAPPQAQLPSAPLPGDPRMNPADPRMNPADPRMNTMDPRLNPADPRMNPADPRMNPADPRLNQADPRLNPADPRLSAVDPRLTATADIKPFNQPTSTADPRLMAVDPRLMAADPRLARQQQQQQQQHQQHQHQHQHQHQQQNQQQNQPPGWPYVGV